MDIKYLLFLQDFRNNINDALTPLMEWASMFATTYLILFAVFYYWNVDRKKGLYTLVSYYFCMFLTPVIKLTACVYRPWIRDARILPAGDSITTATGYSFPSGHTTTVAPLSGGMAVNLWESRKTRIFSLLFILFILLTAFSRNYLGVHTPQDVCVALLISILSLFLTAKLFAYLEEHPEKENLLLLGGFVLCCLALVYITFKPYPMDYNEAGKLIVDPQKMMNDGYGDLGKVMGFIIARFVEKTWIKFEPLKNGWKGFVICLLGLIPLVLMKEYLRPLLTDALGSHWGKLFFSVIHAFYYIALFPLLLKFCNKEKTGRKFPAVSLVFSALILFSSCSSTSELLDSKKKFDLTDAETILSQMSLEEKVAQLFVIIPEELDQKALHKVSSKFVKNLAKYPVGGFILFARHIENPRQLRNFTAGLKEVSPIPPIIAIDEEGGRVARLARHEEFFLPKFANMDAVGKSGDVENARGAGQIIGSYLYSFGFNMDFAPVADVNTSPENIVIGARAFGSDPYLVSKMDAAFLSGLHSTGVKGCIKHFPGHGDTKGDTHAEYVAVTKTWDEIKKVELIPFIENFKNADCVMVAHVTFMDVDSEYPASLSKKLISEKLRGELGYDGLVLTDALDMGAIEKNYGSGEASVLAFEAGNDILLMPQNFNEAYEGMISAVKSGRISEERLNESVLRILRLKGF